MRSMLHKVLRSSVQIGTTQRRLAWALRKDDEHKSRSGNIPASDVRFRSGHEDIRASRRGHSDPV